MNITIDTNAAKSAAVTRTGKLSGVDTSTQKQTAEKAEETTIIRKYDTVELSSDAKKYLSEENDSQTAEPAVTADLTAETETVDTSQLYSYTDDELGAFLTTATLPNSSITPRWQNALREQKNN